MNKLDFSGGPNSWFDLWHTHFDWEGDGNKSWKKRVAYLEELLKQYQSLKKKLSTYPKEYQLWIAIYELDSSQDAVYIHTKNPNADNFPLKVKGDKHIKTKNKDLRKFLEEANFELIRFKVDGGDVYELFQRNVGIPLD